jgi:hypothetical protein
MIQHLFGSWQSLGKGDPTTLNALPSMQDQSSFVAIECWFVPWYIQGGIMGWTRNECGILQAVFEWKFGKSPS